MRLQRVYNYWERSPPPFLTQLMHCCGKLQAVRRWVWPSLLDSGIPLPPVICTGSSDKCCHRRRKWRNSAVISQPSGHLLRYPVWEFLLSGQWNKEMLNRFSTLLFLLMWMQKWKMHMWSQVWKSKGKKKPHRSSKVRSHNPIYCDPHQLSEVTSLFPLISP